jgi:hypothetical protein
MLVIGPLLAWGFLLARPALYLIPPFLAVGFDVLVVRQNYGLLDLIPFAAYPVIAALSTGRRGTAPAPATSTGRPASPYV